MIGRVPSRGILRRIGSHNFKLDRFSPSLPINSSRRFNSRSCNSPNTLLFLGNPSISLLYTLSSDSSLVNFCIISVQLPRLTSFLVSRGDNIRGTEPPSVTICVEISFKPLLTSRTVPVGYIVPCP